MAEESVVATSVEVELLSGAVVAASVMESQSVLESVVVSEEESEPESLASSEPSISAILYQRQRPTFPAVASAAAKAASPPRVSAQAAYIISGVLF